MNGDRLLDSNIMIYLSKHQIELDDISDKNRRLAISVITYMEVMGYPFKNASEKRFLNTLCDTLDIIKLENNIINRVIALREKQKIKLPDAIIAATALENNFELVTRNTNDFKNIKGLKLFNPFDKTTKP